MFALIRGTFRSDYNDGVKQRVLRSIKKSASRTLGKETPEEKQKTLFVCVHYLLGGTDFESEESKSLLVLILPDCLDVVDVVFVTTALEDLLDGLWHSKENWSMAELESENQTIIPNISISRRITLLDILLHQQRKDTKLTVYQRISVLVQTEAIKLLYTCHDHASFAQVCRFLTMHTSCIPPLSRGFALCTLSIHAISDLPYNGDVDNIGAYIKDVADISSLLQYVWNAESATLIPSLKEIFNVISSNKGTTEPSNALGCLVEFIPLKLTHTVVQQIVQDPNISDASMYSALTRMLAWLAWPTASQAHIWILRFFYELALATKFSMLADVTHKTIQQVFSCIQIPNVRYASLSVLCHMLMNYRASPDAFHSILPGIPKLIAVLAKENNPEVNSDHIRLIVNLCYCMMHVHSGFPELYDPLLQALKNFPKPSPSEIRAALKVTSWGCDIIPAAHHDIEYNLDTRSQETDRAGLVNLGNTCYMNSIIQALFAAEEFRNLILSTSCRYPSGSINCLLRDTFAFLMLTRRMAIEPNELATHSRPPWFAAGAQQDCSEYLKHLLDRMNEEQKHVPRSLTSNTSISSENPSQSEATTSQTSSKLFAEDTEPKLRALSSGATKTSIAKFFHGKLRAIIRCSVCGRSSSREETFVDIPLPLEGAHERSVAAGKGGCTKMDQSGSANGERSGTQPELTSVSDMETSTDDSSVAPKTFVQSRDDGAGHSYPVQVEDDTSEDIYDVTATPSRTHELKVLFKSYLEEERMEGDNKYFCSSCDQLQNAVKTTHITHLPSYLLITLMRFTYDTKEQRRTKILDNVEFALEIDVPLHTGSVETSHKYKLWAIVVHSGTSAESGHYYCYARNLRRGADDAEAPWFLYNDSHVTLTRFSSVKDLLGRFLRDTAYVLMYKKADPDAFEDEDGVDPRQLISRDLLARIEADNATFMKDVELAKKRSKKNSSSSFRNWGPDKKPPSPPPPSCGGGGGGDGGHLTTNPMVF